MGCAYSGGVVLCQTDVLGAAALVLLGLTWAVGIYLLGHRNGRFAKTAKSIGKDR